MIHKTHGGVVGPNGIEPFASFMTASLPPVSPPPDWPGYLLETLPLAIVAVVSGGLAIVGCWARRSDEAGRAGLVAIALAIVGHLLWVIALAAALAGHGYGLPTAAAQDIAAIGALLVGISVLRAGDAWVGALLTLAPTLMIFAWPVAWLGFGLAWTLVGVLLMASDSRKPNPTRFA